MKKLFTMILFAAAATSFATAQGNKYADIAYNNKPTVKGDVYHATNSAYNDSYSFSMRGKAAKLLQINQGFDQQIAAVKNNRHLKYRQQQQQIKSLEKQRQQAIRNLEKQYDRPAHKPVNHSPNKW